MASHRFLKHDAEIKEDRASFVPPIGRTALQAKKKPSREGGSGWRRQHHAGSLSAAKPSNRHRYIQFPCVVTKRTMMGLERGCGWTGTTLWSGP